MEDRKIGIIGGMGPMASQLFYKMITEMTEADQDQDHVNMVMISDTSMPDRTGAILAGEYDEVRERLLKDARMLESCGCEAIGVTCNTAHFFVDMIEDEISIPFIHMIKETAEAAAASDPGAKIAVLATDGTVRTQLYQKRLEEKGLIPYVPDADIQREVMHQIYDRIKRGLPWDALSWERIEADVRKAGCCRAVLACTELSVIKRDNGLDDFYIDPMAVLAEKMILFSGRKLKKIQKTA